MGRPQRQTVPAREPAGGTVGDSVDQDGASSSDASKQRLDRGATLGRYVVLYRLGIGGMGVIYAAYDPELDRKVALKILPGDASGASHGARLLREAKAIAQLSHPNVVTVHDVGTFEGRVFIAMEYVEGVTLGEWLREQPRSWRQILQTICAAGDGLAAAHAAGLIHRDFKPDNVLVDETGRVVVLDFGLARRTPISDADGGPTSPDPETHPSLPGFASVGSLSPAVAESLLGSWDDLGEPLTRTGARVGTPAYMAPEQHLGAQLDERTDQFAFCVVLWEALYGIRPFQGPTPRATALSVIRGVVAEPPRGAGVPGWLRRILQRGLRTPPARRYRNMAQLLAELRTRAAPRMGLRVAVLGGLFGVAGAAWLGSGYLADDPCPWPEDRLAGGWDDHGRARIQQAFRATGAPYADTTFARVQHELDAYVEKWNRERQDACAATFVRHVQSEPMLDRRALCLDNLLSDVRALTTEFQTADQTVVARAVEAVADLGRVEGCRNIELFLMRTDLPEDRQSRDAIDAVRSTLTDAKAKEAAGRYAVALGTATAAKRRALELGYQPLVAEASLRVASLLEHRGEFEAAQRELFSTILAAEACHHDLVLARAWTRMVWVAGVERLDTANGELWARFAQAAIDRLGGDELLNATLAHNIGGLRYREGHFDDAWRHYRSALAVQERLLGPEDPTVAMTYNHLGNVKLEEGDLATARSYSTRSLDLRRRALGEDHPKVAASLNNLAAIAAKAGDQAKALALIEQSLAIVGDSGGSEELVALTLGSEVALEHGQAEPYLARLRELASADAEIRRKLSPRIVKAMWAPKDAAAPGDPTRRDPQKAAAAALGTSAR